MVSPSWQGFEPFVWFPPLPLLWCDSHLSNRGRDRVLLRVHRHVAPGLGLKQEENRQGLAGLGEGDAP